MNLEEEEEEEEEEEFYESLDRILSSSCSSTSASDQEQESERRQHRHHADSFEVWISEPASVEERRRRLLCLMGLAGDPSLSRQKSEGQKEPPPASVVARSRSDGAVGRAPKPPLVSRLRSSPAMRFEVRKEEEEEEEEELDEEEINRRRFTIKNLDTGKEFVVAELQEGGTWKELREVGTDRRLSMDEFEICVGRSPIVQELMRRQNGEHSSRVSVDDTRPRAKKRGGWLRSIKNVTRMPRERQSDEKDTSSEKGGRRSSSATDDSQDGRQGPERTRVHQHGKLNKELTGLFMSQELNAHNGSIWSIKFSLDGKYLASAGEDCVIHVWEVSECERKGEGRNSEQNLLADTKLALACVEGNHWEKKRRAKVHGRKSQSTVDQLMLPEYVFGLSEKPICSFRGHLEDVLDLSWSQSQYLLSSSMDKTVRLWHLSGTSCLRTFSHSDYVTCIQFNPVDDRYFISGSLDEKVRIWSIPDRQVVDWHDLNEMVTAASYTPNGQGALVGSHKGSCHLYNTSDNKLLQESQIDLQNKKKKSSQKKITGFQFAPGSSSEVLVTSADSRIRVIDGTEIVHKFKGFRNTSSQISACLTANGRYVICASEDSRVYVWRYDASQSRSNRSKGVVTVTQSYEHFYCEDVTVAVPWPTSSLAGVRRSNSSKENGPNRGESLSNAEVPAESYEVDRCLSEPRRSNGFPQHNGFLSTNNGQWCERSSATWPEEKLLTARKYNPQSNGGSCNVSLQVQSKPAWGMVIVTAGRGGQIKAFQNFGFQVQT